MTFYSSTYISKVINELRFEKVGMALECDFNNNVFYYKKVDCGKYLGSLKSMFFTRFG